MSWVAVGGGPGAAYAALYHCRKNGVPSSERKIIESPHWLNCEYCGKAPDSGQKESRCFGCGAPLDHKDSPKQQRLRLEIQMKMMQMEAQMKLGQYDP